MGAQTIDLVAKKKAMAEYLRTAIPGLKVHPYFMSTYVTPCAVILLRPQYHKTFSGQILLPLEARILVLTKVGTGTSGAESLDEYIGYGTAKSIPAALSLVTGDPTWDGAWADTKLVGVESDVYRQYEGGSLAYYGQYLSFNLYA